VETTLVKEKIKNEFEEAYGLLELRLKDCIKDLDMQRSFLDQVQRISQLGSWQWDLSSEEVVWSHELWRILGLSSEKRKPSYRLFLTALHPEDKAFLAEAFRAACKARKSFDAVHRIVRPDGEVRLVHQRAAVTLHDQGRPLRMVGFIQDITSHKRTEGLLRKARDELARRLEELTAINTQSRRMARLASIDSVVSYAHKQLKATLDPDVVIVYLLESEGLVVQGPFPPIKDFPDVHKVGDCLCGLAAKEGKTFHSEDIHSDPRATMPECGNAGLRSFCAVPLIERDTTIGVFGVGSYAMRDFSKRRLFLETFGGQLAVALSNAKLLRKVEQAREELEHRVDERTRELTDTNERLKKKIKELALTETALRESEARFRELAELLPQIVFEVDLNGNFTFLNRAALQELGYTAEELSWGLDSHRVFIPKTPKATMRNLVSSLHGKTFREEYEVRRKDGSAFHALAHSSPIIREGGIVGLRGVAIDITDQRQAEQKQAELIEEIKHFAYVVSHDLHAPLVNIKGFHDELASELDVIRPMLEKLLPFLEEEERKRVAYALEQDIPESLHYINAGIVRMSRLIGEILELSRVGRRRLVFERLDMNEIVDNVLKSLEHQMRTAGVKVKVGELPETVADRTSMEQIIANLIDNAVKYVDDDRRPVIEISGLQFPDRNVFVIRDTGRGIQPADRSRIFHAFQRSGTEPTPGMGMGLAHTRTLIGRHGGQIWCESEPGVGSTFTFTVSNLLGQEENPG
jgi:PAS domain S-box-containing protein